MKKCSGNIDIAKILFFVSAAFLTGNDRFWQRYEGLTYKVFNVRKYIKPVVLFLQENGYDLGKASF